MDCVFHMYMHEEDKAMVMTLFMTVVKQHSQHIMTPTKNNIYDSSETINTYNKA
jgi:hypothetical protein